MKCVEKESVDDVVAIKANIIQDFDIRLHGIGKTAMEKGGLEMFGFHVGIGKGISALVAVMEVHCSRKFCEALDESVFEGHGSHWNDRFNWQWGLTRCLQNLQYMISIFYD